MVGGAGTDNERRIGGGDFSRPPDSGGSGGNFENDREKLVKFLFEFHDIMNRAIDEPETYRLDLDPELQALARDAWKDALPLWEDVVRRTRALSPRNMILHGLHGPQLELKLSAWERLKRRVADNPIAWAIKQLFAQLDNILKSILSATGAGTALEEIKQSLESLVKPDD